MRKNKIIKDKDIIQKVNEMITPYSGNILHFERLHKEFGNLKIKFKLFNEIHEFESDKGQIYYNQTFVSDNKYHETGKDDSLLIIFDMIKDIIIQHN